MNDLSKEDYILDPCGKCATAYHKNSEIILTNLRVVNEKEYAKQDGDGEITRFFKLIHKLEKIPEYCPQAGYSIETVSIPNDIVLVSEIITKCYDNIDMSPAKILKMTKDKVFDNTCWIFVIDKKTDNPVALGIADFDAEIKEGSLEWIQVLDEFRGQGFGQVLVSELLKRLGCKANFVTVSGQTNSASNPEALYRKCGFEGNNTWLAIKINNKTDF